MRNEKRERRRWRRRTKMGDGKKGEGKIGKVMRRIRKGRNE